MIRVEFTDREARAIANVVSLFRDALINAGEEPDGPEEILPTAHAKLVSALEQGETVAA